jgi:hypothetical protein
MRRRRECGVNVDQNIDVYGQPCPLFVACSWLRHVVLQCLSADRVVVRAAIFLGPACRDVLVLTPPAFWAACLPALTSPALGFGACRWRLTGDFVT